MKCSIAFFVGLVIPASAICQDAGAPNPVEIRIVNNADARAFEIIVGPFELPAGTRAAAEMEPMGHGGHDAHGGAVYAPVTTLEAPESVYLTGFSYEVRDGTGAVLSTEFLHHLNIINPDNRELFVPISQRMLALGKWARRVEE